MRIEVLIPHLSRADRLAQALGALRRQTLVPEVCVADNGSLEETRELIEACHPGVRHLRFGRNLGYGAALNRAVRTGGADFVIFLNDDVVPSEGFVEAILAAHRATGAEMVAPCLLRPDGRIDSLGLMVDRSLNAYDAAHAAPLEAARDFPHGRLLAPMGGGAGFLRRAFEEVGGFDERFFAYLEDVDLGLRMRLAGHRCTPAPDALAWHHHSSTLGSGSPAKNRLMGESRGHLLWKHGRSLDARARLEAALTDGAVYVGQLLLDRNPAALRGRLDARRRHRGELRPPRDPRLRELPLLPIGVGGGLTRRLRNRLRRHGLGVPALGFD